MVGIDRSRHKNWQGFWFDGESDGSCDAWLSGDKTGPLEGKHHLMDGWWGDFEVALQIGLCRRAPLDASIRPDKGEVLALLLGEAGFGLRRILAN